MRKGVLFELRKQRGLAQEAVADSLNVARATVSSWETGRTEPGNEYLAALAKLFDVPVGYLLGLDDAENSTAVPSRDLQRDIDAMRHRLLEEQPLRLRGKVLNKAARKRMLDVLELGTDIARYEIMRGGRDGEKADIPDGDMGENKPG